MVTPSFIFFLDGEALFFLVQRVNLKKAAKDRLKTHNKESVYLPH